MNAHEIDYKIYGEEMQFVERELDPNEGVVAEAGSFMMMDEGIKMETIFGDGSQKDQGFLGKILGAGGGGFGDQRIEASILGSLLPGKLRVLTPQPVAPGLADREHVLGEGAGVGEGEGLRERVDRARGPDVREEVGRRQGGRRGQDQRGHLARGRRGRRHRDQRGPANARV